MVLCLETVSSVESNLTVLVLVLILVLDLLSYHYHCFRTNGGMGIVHTDGLNATVFDAWTNILHIYSVFFLSTHLFASITVLFTSCSNTLALIFRFIIGCNFQLKLISRQIRVHASNQKQFNAERCDVSIFQSIKIVLSWNSVMRQTGGKMAFRILITSRTFAALQEKDHHQILIKMTDICDKYVSTINQYWR